MYSERFNLNITQLPFENAASQKPLKSFHFKFIILFSFLLLRIAHSISFDWFRSGLEWILYFEFCLLKLLIFYQKLLWNIRYRTMCWHKDIAKFQIWMKTILNQCLGIQYECRLVNFLFLCTFNETLIDFIMTLLTKRDNFCHLYVVKF